MGLGTNSALDSIVHPDLLASMPRVYPAVVTIQAATETQGDDYSVQQAWENVSGMIGIRGSLAAATVGALAEMKRPEFTGVEFSHVCDLTAYYPEITVSHRALIARANGETAQTFDIVGIKHDSQAESTRLELEIVSF